MAGIIERGSGQSARARPWHPGPLGMDGAGRRRAGRSTAASSPSRCATSRSSGFACDPATRLRELRRPARDALDRDRRRARRAGRRLVRRPDRGRVRGAPSRPCRRAGAGVGAAARLEARPPRAQRYLAAPRLLGAAVLARRARCGPIRNCTRRCPTCGDRLRFALAQGLRVVAAAPASPARMARRLAWLQQAARFADRRSRWTRRRWSSPASPSSITSCRRGRPPSTWPGCLGPAP